MDCHVIAFFDCILEIMCAFPPSERKIRVQVPIARFSYVLSMVLITAGLDTLSIIVGVFRAHHDRLAITEAVLPGLHRHSDLVGFYRRIGDYGTSAFFSTRFTIDLFNYPALMAQPLRWLFALHTPLQRYNECLLIWCCVVLAGTSVLLKRRGFSVGAAGILPVVLLTINFPFQLLIFTSNLELFVWMVVTVGIACYVAGFRTAAAIAFGIGAAMKYYPIAFLGVFRFRRDWLRIVYGLVAAIAANLYGLYLLGPSVSAAQAGLAMDRRIFADLYLNQWRPVDSTFNHSLYELVKLLFIVGLHRTPGWLLPAFICIAAPVTLVLYLFRVQHLPFIQRLLCVAVMGVWLMPISQDYTLVLLLLPVIALCTRMSPDDCNLRFKSDRSLRMLFALLGVVFSALTFLRIGSIGLGGVVRAICLGLILFLGSQSSLLAHVKQVQSASPSEG